MALGKMVRNNNIYVLVCNSKIVIERSEPMNREFTRYYCACKTFSVGSLICDEYGIWLHSHEVAKLTKDKLLELVLSKLSVEEKSHLRRY